MKALTYLRMASASIGLSLLAPGLAMANCFPPKAGTPIDVVARSVIDRSDYVGFAMVASDRSPDRKVGQGMDLVHAFKGKTGHVLMEAESRGEGIEVDSSKFREVNGRVGDLAFVALKLSGDGAYIPACIAADLRSFPLPDMVEAVSRAARPH